MISPKKKNLKKIFFIALIAAFPLYSAVNNWLWRIDKAEYSVDEFNRDYRVYIELMAWQMGMNSSDLKQFIEKSDELDDPRTKALLAQLKPEAFAENYILLSLLKKHAQENKFFDRPDSKMKSEFIKDYILLQIYLNEVISKLPVEINNEDVEKEWVTQRDKNENLKSIPMDQGMIYMRQKMVQDKRESQRKDFIKSLYEKYKIEKNEDYLKILGAVKLDNK